MTAVLARSSRSSRSERVVGPWSWGTSLKASVALWGSPAPRAMIADTTMRRSSGSRPATLRAPLSVAESKAEAGFELVGLGETGQNGHF